ncbi:HNH endonuclease [Tsukamurella sp. 1534]|uniref:HNH endonuclease n=1 Tax=Tsukamurella sp. 1534 TaxID=1151061 RepID=UPI000592AFDB|nr:hypothetical protein [Tsukamurella sp. 1534]
MKSTTARGLGWTHQQNRRNLLAKHIDGTPCWWCNRPMYREPAQNFDSAGLEADHSVARAHGGHHADRMLHRQCNRERGDGTRDDQRPAITGTDQTTHQPPEASALAPRHMPWPW